MSKTLLKQDDIRRILYGATFLGGGGGGPLETAVEILEKLAKERDIQIALYSVDDEVIDPRGYGAMVACLGSPEAMKAGTFGSDGMASFEAFKKSLANAGKDVKYLYSGEMGGFNTFAPMLVAIYSGNNSDDRIKFLDVDTNGRAVPELNTSLNTARGYAPYPVGIGTLNMSVPQGKCNELIAYGENASESERIARGICAMFNNQIGFSTWAMCREDFEKNAVVGCVSLAMRVGEALEQAKAKPDIDPMVFICKVLECSSFGKGRIIKKETKIIAGFDCGTTTIEISEGKELGIFTIDFQNENLIMRNENASVIITAPEIITMLCMDKNEKYAHPLTNASTEEGMEIELILAPADEKWWAKDYEANLVWIDALKRVNYGGEQIRYRHMD